jgi:hypothetical protein
MSSMVETTETAILSRIVDASRGDLVPELARAVLLMEFSSADREEMHRLAQVNQAGRLSSGEEAALDAYRRVGYFLDLMKSKARKSLQHDSSH